MVEASLTLLEDPDSLQCVCDQRLRGLLHRNPPCLLRCPHHPLHSNFLGDLHACSLLPPEGHRVVKVSSPLAWLSVRSAQGVSELATQILEPIVPGRLVWMELEHLHFFGSHGPVQ